MTDNEAALNSILSFAIMKLLHLNDTKELTLPVEANYPRGAIGIAYKHNKDENTMTFKFVMEGDEEEENDG